MSVKKIWFTGLTPKNSEEAHVVSAEQLIALIGKADTEVHLEVDSSATVFLGWLQALCSRFQKTIYSSRHIHIARGDLAVSVTKSGVMVMHQGT